MTKITTYGLYLYGTKTKTEKNSQTIFSSSFHPLTCYKLQKAKPGRNHRKEGSLLPSCNLDLY